MKNGDRLRFSKVAVTAVLTKSFTGSMVGGDSLAEVDLREELKMTITYVI
jgi:hypothetical protein